MTTSNNSNSQAKFDELYAHYEAVRSNARHLAADRKVALQQHMDELDEAKDDLEEKWNRVKNFGDEAVEELSKAFFSSADAFSDKLDNVKKNMS